MKFISIFCSFYMVKIKIKCLDLVDRRSKEVGLGQLIMNIIKSIL